MVLMHVCEKFLDAPYHIELLLNGLRCLQNNSQLVLFSQIELTGARATENENKVTHPHDTSLKSFPTHDVCIYVVVW